jgi:hypothetical protein
MAEAVDSKADSFCQELDLSLRTAIFASGQRAEFAGVYAL